MIMNTSLVFFFTKYQGTIAALKKLLCVECARFGSAFCVSCPALDPQNGSLNNGSPGKNAPS